MPLQPATSKRFPAWQLRPSVLPRPQEENDMAEILAQGDGQGDGSHFASGCVQR